MGAQLHNDQTQIFSDQLLGTGNDKIKLHPKHLNTICIKLTDNACTVFYLKNELRVIETVFPDILNNYSHHNWLSNL